MHDVTRGTDERIVSSKTVKILCTSFNKQSGGFDETNLTHFTRRATIVARAQSSRNSEGHYSGRGNVINVINLKLIPSWAFPCTCNIPSGMS